MHYVQLNNQVLMPQQIMGTSVCDYRGKASELHTRMANSVRYCIQNQIAGIDSSRDYDNEPILGDIFHKMFTDGVAKRDDLFITTKVGNSQQRKKNMQAEIDQSLKNLQLDYVDLWMLHWPLPEYWLDNWKQLTEIYMSGKVRAIGMANLRERHILELEKNHLAMPHVVQIEHHPFRTVTGFLDLCKKHQIQVEAYSSNCLMLPFARENQMLNKIASAHNKTVAQVMTRWHIQHDIIPIFSSLNPVHIKENVDVYDFELLEEEMKQIFDLNQDYKFHPESLNCPGY